MTAQISFYTRNCCIVKIPDNMTKEEAKSFLIDKIARSDLEDFVETWIDFEVEDFELKE